MLPDRSVLIGQKLVENAKNQKFKCVTFINFQTMWNCLNSLFPTCVLWHSGCYIVPKGKKSHFVTNQGQKIECQQISSV